MERIVIKIKVGGSWRNMTKIQNEDDWRALSVWLTTEQIEELRRNGTLQTESHLYYVTSDKQTIEFETNYDQFIKKYRIKLKHSNE